MIECPTCERIGMPPARSHEFGHAAAADQVVEDLRAGMLLERVERDERGDGAAVDQVALLVDDEHAVGVAVERNAEIAVRALRTAACRSTMFSGSIGLAG